MAARRWIPSWIKKRVDTGSLSIPGPPSPGRFPAAGSEMNLSDRPKPATHEDKT